uniref:Uncharacterized protein n=1 Tax=Triticum urartu TaxID=4572 RepID=A0A8R7UHP1_TRIUA
MGGRRRALGVLGAWRSARQILRGRVQRIRSVSGSVLGLPLCKHSRCILAIAASAVSPLAKKLLNAATPQFATLAERLGILSAHVQFVLQKPKPKLQHLLVSPPPHRNVVRLLQHCPSFPTPLQPVSLCHRP